MHALLELIADKLSHEDCYRLDLSEQTLAEYLKDILPKSAYDVNEQNRQKLFLQETAGPNNLIFTYKVHGSRIDHRVTADYSPLDKTLRITATPTKKGLVAHFILLALCVFLPWLITLYQGSGTAIKLLGLTAIVYSLGWLITYLSMGATISGVKYFLEESYRLNSTKCQKIS